MCTNMETLGVFFQIIMRKKQLGVFFFFFINNEFPLFVLFLCSHGILDLSLFLNFKVSCLCYRSLSQVFGNQIWGDKIVPDTFVQAHIPHQMITLGQSTPVCQIWATSRSHHGLTSAKNKPNKLHSGPQPVHQNRNELWPRLGLVPVYVAHFWQTCVHGMACLWPSNAISQAVCRLDECVWSGPQILLPMLQITSLLYLNFFTPL